MKIRNLIYILLINFAVNSLICYNLFAQGKYSGEEIMQLYKSQGVIKVNFYHWDRKTNQRQEFIGRAELKEGKLIFDVKDKRLEKMLKWDFHTIVAVEENGKKTNKFVTYKFGTIEHLESVIEHCKDISCIAEIVEK